ncbi:MAG: heparinase II/III family protein [Proteobacteria bacterium]|nr:heparinase II/III family protein [Pseudomonadota bacterium]
MARFPALAQAWAARRAAALPLPDPRSPALLAAARRVLAFEEAVHGAHLAGVGEGRFTLIGRTVEFGGLERVDWRIGVGDPDWHLWRMSLAYMGYAVPLMARGKRGGLAVVLSLVGGLEAGAPFAAAGVFRDAWNPYAASHRAINLLSGLALYLGAGGEAGAAEARALLEHVRFAAGFVLANLERDLGYNHLLRNMAALGVVSAGLRGLPAALAGLPGLAERVLATQVLADGGHAERSPLYHALALQDARLLVESGLVAGDAAEARIARMEAALGAMSHPDGDIALFNDSWLGGAPPASALGARTPGPRAALAETGYVRLGAEGDAVLLDCGPCGPDDNPGHAHADFLAIEASVGGRRFLVDAGVPTYAPGGLRDLSRSASAHNGPRLEGCEPIEFWASFRVGRRGRARPLDLAAGPAGLAPLSAAGWQDGLRPFGVVPARLVALWPGRGLLVADLWLGGADRPASSSFLVAGDWRHEGGAAPGRFSQGGAVVEATALAGRLAPVEPGRWWPGYGVERPAHRLELAPEPCEGGRRAAVLFSWSGGRPEIGAERMAALWHGLSTKASAAARGP